MEVEISSVVEITKNHDGPVVMVDDNPTDIFIAERSFKKMGLTNRFLSYLKPVDFIVYLRSVEQQQEPMPAVVLLDINMPDMNGFEVLKIIRSSDAFKSIPVVMILSNSSNQVDLKRSISLGADGFQTKPFSLGGYLSFYQKMFKNSEYAYHPEGRIS